MTLEEALDTPGIWIVPLRIGFILIEVDDEKVCRQLSPYTLERDGVLSKEGWDGPMSVAQVCGPFERKGGKV